MTGDSGGNPFSLMNQDEPVLSQRTRTWSNQGEDENSIHVVGNGRTIVLAAGPNVDCLFGPPYSSPNILQLATRCPNPVTDEAHRELGASIWHHNLKSEGRPVLTFTEFAASNLTAYIRVFECLEPGIDWVIKPHSSGGFHPSQGIQGAYFQRLPPGTLIFRDPYITDQWACHWVIPQGSCHAELNAEGELVVRLEPGNGSLTIVGASEYPAGITETEELNTRGATAYLKPTRSHWREFTRGRLDNRPELTRLSQEAAEDLDGTAVMIKALQAAQGGGIIGWHSPMAYIRDLYGASRGMLALGMFDEARQLLEFRFDKFKRFGDLRTAELIGTDCARHTYNDEVEGPAYLILQARDYLRVTGDSAMVRDLWPMLEWCWSVQQHQLAGGLLPFNGDETYIPYGLFPIEGVLQGSADTTLAFIAAGEWLTRWAEEERLWTSDQAELQQHVISESRQSWRKTFVVEDRVWANAPQREQWITPPRFCQWGSLGWLERDPQSGRYVSPESIGQELPPVVPPEKMTLNSVSLLADYLGEGLLTEKERRAMVERILSFAHPNGMIPTCNEEDCGTERVNRVVQAAGGGTAGRIGDLCVGYDPGLLLIALTELKHPAAPAAYARLMRMIDQAGAWNEYYDAEDRPVRGCIRANIWASGINTEAAVRFLLGTTGNRDHK